MLNNNNDEILNQEKEYELYLRKFIISEHKDEYRKTVDDLTLSLLAKFATEEVPYVEKHLPMLKVDDTHLLSYLHQVFMKCLLVGYCLHSAENRYNLENCEHYANERLQFIERGSLVRERLSEEIHNKVVYEFAEERRRKSLWNRIINYVVDWLLDIANAVENWKLK